jgi:hypothetical protein
MSSKNSKASCALLTTARVHLPFIFHEEIRENLMNVKATFLSRRRCTIYSKYRYFWQIAVIKAVWRIERVVNLGYLDLQRWRAMMVHCKSTTGRLNPIDHTEYIDVHIVGLLRIE